MLIFLQDLLISLNYKTSSSVSYIMDYYYTIISFPPNFRGYLKGQMLLPQTFK